MPAACGASTPRAIRWNGVSIPDASPSRQTVPASQSTSSRRPCSRSTVSDAFHVAGMVRTNASVRWTSSSTEPDPLGAGHRHHLAHALLGQTPGGLVLADSGERHPCHRAEGGHRGQEQELPPDLEPDVAGRRGLDASGVRQREEPGQPRALVAVQLAQRQAIQRVVPDHAGRRDLAVDDDHAADDVRPAMHAGHDVEGLDAVLQAHDRGLGSDHRADGPRRGLHVEELRPQQHHLGRADHRRIVRGRGRGDQQVAERAQDPEPVLADCRQMRPPRDEGHLRARRRQPRADVAADGAGPHHRDLHVGPTRVGGDLMLASSDEAPGAHGGRASSPG